MSLDSAYTPPVHRASGIGKSMILKTIDFAKQLGLRIVPACSFATGFFSKGNRYSDLFRGGKDEDHSLRLV